MSYQMQQTALPGCVISVCHAGSVVFDCAFGVANLRTEEPLTPQHRFRVASHSKTFTAVGIMKLWEAGRLHLDDRIGSYVMGLHPQVADATIAELLSHGAGLMRDGRRAPHWQVAAPFFSSVDLAAELTQPPAIELNTQFKYSNLGFGLLGMAIEAITGETYNAWTAREVVSSLGLENTTPDLIDATSCHPLAAGHSGRLAKGRGAIDGSHTTHALSAATGFVSTARDLAIFFASLSPSAKNSVLSVGSRREMLRPQRSIEHTNAALYYGYGLTIAEVDGHTIVGHRGAFPGFISRTVLVPEWDVSISVVTNAIDGPADDWAEGIVSIMHRFEEAGTPTERLKHWEGRWWTIWSAIDLVAVGDRVLVADPSTVRPFSYAAELAIVDHNHGTIALANGFHNEGEAVALELEGGAAVGLKLGAAEWVDNPGKLAIAF
ncbi:serine hydrolase domain-containing protein [Ensifer sp. 4252]|uniref:serine hydrolase domain-containing protein n=1 Tax=Ensifer sp. 4252 TaxID=3373915 RepID=UPI003D1A3C0E